MKVLRICCRIKKISPPLSACLKSVLFWFDSYFTLKPFSPKFKYKFSLHSIVQSFNESSENLLPYQENISSVISLWTCVGFPIRVKPQLVRYCYFMKSVFIMLRNLCFGFKNLTHWAIFQLDYFTTNLCFRKYDGVRFWIWNNSQENQILK